MRNLIPLLLAAILASPSTKAAEPEKTDLFVSGNDGYGRYRIPALIVSQKGTLLAFCEGRRKAAGLTGDIDLVLRRSTDQGKTWQPMQLVADAAGDTLGNPCPVIDRESGTILLLLTKSPGEKTETQIVDGPGEGSTTVWLCRSKDDGATWSPPEEITTQAKKRTWTWYGTGPGIGLTLASGRLFVPSYHAEAGTKIYKAHSLFSDDHGSTWQIGADVADYTTEPQAAVRADGTLVINCRSIHQQGFRTIATSTDNGATWSKPFLDKGLTDPSCQGSLLAFSGPRPGAEGEKTLRWLFSNPPGPKRRDLTVRLSYDEGQTWKHSRVLEPIGSEYSCLCRLAGGQIGILYERNPGEKYAPHITFARFDLTWLTQGQDGGWDLAASAAGR